jgi:hypothetical protein
MVVKNQKNLIHDVVMNFIPKKKVDPPKVSLEQMVKDHTKLLAQGGKNKLNISPKSVNSSQLIKEVEPVEQHHNIINEIEKKIIDKPIKITKVEPIKISDIVNSFGGDIQTKSNSRRRSRNHVKSTVEKLIDNKLKSEFIENLISNNSNNKQIVNKIQSPIANNLNSKQNDNKIKSLANNTNYNNIGKKIENIVKSPTTKKFKSENNINIKQKIVQHKDQLFKIPLSKNANSTTNNLKDSINAKRVNSAGDSKRQNSAGDSKRQNRTNNYLRNTSNKNKNEAEIQLNSFRDYEIKIKNSRKKSKKNERKKSKKYKGSKKNSNKKSKGKSNDITDNIQINKGVPNYLKQDLKQLIGNNIKINNDNFNFNKH